MGSIAEIWLSLWRPVSCILKASWPSESALQIGTTEAPTPYIRLRAEVARQGWCEAGSLPSASGAVYANRLVASSHPMLFPWILIDGICNSTTSRWPQAMFRKYRRPREPRLPRLKARERLAAVRKKKCRARQHQRKPVVVSSVRPHINDLLLRVRAKTGMFASRGGESQKIGRRTRLA
jgi:hypothetical protein